METLLVKLKNKNALAILKGLEKANIIKLIDKDKKEKASPIHFKGLISKERTMEMINEIEKSRNEWNERTV